MSFNGTRLRVARTFKDLTQRDLAEKVAVSHPLIGEYEKGRKEPKGDILEALAAVLDVDSGFFFEHDEDEFKEPESNFRRRISASDRLRKKVLAQATLLGVVVKYLNRFVRLPAFDIPNLLVATEEDVEIAAERCRERWKLGLDTPIASMSRVLENAGVVLVQADPDTATKVDAFSRFGDVSVVVLNGAKGSTSRTFFDTAHELGHGVMHRTKRQIPLAQREAEADRFAGAFLLPREQFAREFFGAGRSDWGYLLELKRHWGVSLQAIIYRAYQLGLIDAAEYRVRFRYIAKRGWRTDEPEEPSSDEPELFRLALQRFTADTGNTVAELVRALRWKPSLFTAVTGVDVTAPNGSNVVSLHEYRQRVAS